MSSSQTARPEELHCRIIVRHIFSKFLPLFHFIFLFYTSSSTFRALYSFFKLLSFQNRFKNTYFQKLDMPCSLVCSYHPWPQNQAGGVLDASWASIDFGTALIGDWISLWVEYVWLQYHELMKFKCKRSELESYRDAPVPAG